jgi:fluoroquinolone transport system permease protein
VTLLQVVRALGPIDAKSVRRDPLLRWLIAYPLAMALLVRWGVPIVRVHLIARFQFDVQPYYGLLMSFVLLLPPMLAGIVVGFLLLDQRDDQTLTALQVTPLTLSGYLSYRITVPTVVSFVVTLAMPPLAGLLDIGPVATVIAALSSCLLAPIYAVFLGAFASNKVQGFALAKALGVLLIPPLVAYFVNPPWQILFGLDPLYWPVKVFWLVEANAVIAWVYLAVGSVMQLFVLRFLLHRMNRMNHRGT